MTLELHIRLLSDTTFGRGDGVAGLVDTEVEHDRYGFPYIRGRTLKGLLAETCEDLCFALARQPSATDPYLEQLDNTKRQLFGGPGSTEEDEGSLHIGSARLSEDFRRVVIAEIERNQPRITPVEVLESLTTIRRQTAIDEYGAPKKGSLRALRVVLRETEFSAKLSFANNPPTNLARALLAVSAQCLHRGGTGRNRGRGRFKAWLTENDQEVTARDYKYFKQLFNAQGAAV